MPYTQSQNKLFRAAAHNPAIAKKHGMSQGQASKMASEGVKRKSLVKALRNHGKRSYSSGIGY